MKEKGRVFKPVTPKRTFEEISEQIRRLILQGVFKPGDRLPSERELAEKFGTGRMSVREALRKLEEAGLIYVKQGADGGIFVKGLDWSGFAKTISMLFSAGNITLKELAEARLAIESIILKEGITAFTEKDIRALEENIKICEKLLPEKRDAKYPSYADARLGDFHLVIADSCNNRLFTYFVKSILALYSDQKLYVPDYEEYERHLHQHKKILSAIKERDVDAALAALEEHIKSITSFSEKMSKSLVRSSLW